MKVTDSEVKRTTSEGDSVAAEIRSCSEGDTGNALQKSGSE
jgi:hypothetical protein